MQKKICILLLSILLTACSSTNSSDSNAETEAVSETTTTAVTTTDDSEQTTTTTTTSISEKETDDSSKTETSTKLSTESTTTTTSQPVPTTSKASTKASQKPVVTTTTTAAKKTVATTTTAKQNTNSNVKPSGLTRLEDAVWELCTTKNHNNVTYRNIVRDELIKYGQAYCKSNPTCFKLFTINTKLYPYYDKNGKPLYAPCDMKGKVIAVGSNVEFPDDEHLSCFSPYSETTQSARLAAVRSFINSMHLLIERVLCNALSHGIANMEWYITYGDEAGGIDWNVMAHIPDGEWVYF